jgi:mannose-6-phosphate isomerase-like protein (cupin superfamily)
VCGYENEVEVGTVPCATGVGWNGGGTNPPPGQAALLEEVTEHPRLRVGASGRVSDEAVPVRRLSIPEVARGLEPPLARQDLVNVNDSVVRIAGLEGELPFHHHDEDEFFLCWEGALRIEIQDGDAVELAPGDVVVIPRGVEHRPVAERWAVVILIERPETLQLGNE